MFIDPNATIDVSDDDGNTITIKAKMDFGDQGKVEAALIQLRLKAQPAQSRNGRRQKKKRARAADEMEIDATYSYSARQVAILQVCIKRWSGPAFEGTPCTPDNIALLNPTEPLVEQVLETIDEMNASETTKPPEGEPVDPNHPTPVLAEGLKTDGDQNLGEPD
jgi:hypothetical protein